MPVEPFLRKNGVDNALNSHPVIVDVDCRIR